MGVEFELKFRATPDILQALDEAVSGPRQRIAMQTTYYDTPEGALSARRYTLRRRLENNVSICTLKTPAPKGSRAEFEVEWDAITEAIPMLCKLGAPENLQELTRSGVTPICGARFTRIAKQITQPAFTAELALDLGVLTGGGKEIPLCEAELELKSGDRDAMTAYALLLAAQFHLVTEPKSKFRRALELYRGE